MNQRNITKYQLRKARRLLRLGFFVKSLKKYNSILEEEINSPLKNFKIGILNGNLTRFDDALHFSEENYFFNFWLNLRKLLFKNSELLLCLRKFKAKMLFGLLYLSSCYKYQNRKKTPHTYQVIAEFDTEICYKIRYINIHK